ncbi:DUF924 family protein [Vibrio ishigakensis]|uniref:DUF924 family protein n=1 Tax=Vibrio ishigakensis TaxID=1481914 RepID=UPI0021C345DF|nr:DUF924 family protein [Vibrio ishigakensis]
MQYKDVLDFWFNELEVKDWFAKNLDLDEQIRQRFGKLHQSAVQCELYSWREMPEGRLAEIIVLDQFSRNLYRDSAKAFAADALALALAQQAVQLGEDNNLTSEQKSFLYMPYMHSESLLVHEQGRILFEHAGLTSNLEFHDKHTAIIKRFGRYPHRNSVLGRDSTAEEKDFLTQPGSSF